MGVCTVQNLENDYMRCCPTDAKGLKYSAVWCVTAPARSSQEQAHCIFYWRYFMNEMHFYYQMKKIYRIMGNDFSLLNAFFQITFSRICWTPRFNCIGWEIVLCVGQVTFFVYIEPHSGFLPFPPSLLWR